MRHWRRDYTFICTREFKYFWVLRWISIFFKLSVKIIYTRPIKYGQNCDSLRLYPEYRLIESVWFFFYVYYACSVICAGMVWKYPGDYQKTLNIEYFHKLIAQKCTYKLYLVIRNIPKSRNLFIDAYLYL